MVVTALWGTPRSVSSAFEKTFTQNSQAKVFHEPFSDVYYFSTLRRSNRTVSFFGEDRDKLNYDCSIVIEKIKSAATLSSIVFLKDFPYEVLPYFDDNIKDFLRSIINTFIIRHPYEVLASWYTLEQKISEEEFGGKITEEEFGFDSLYRMFHIVTKDLKQKPIVVEANRFRQNPENILSDYCQNIGVTFEPQMLSWEDGRVQPWNPREARIHSYWHEGVNNSTRINPPKEVDMDYIQEHIRAEHLDMVERGVSIYEKLLVYAL